MVIGDRVRLGLQYFTGATAIIGGLLLASRPDGTLLHANRSALTTSPFDDWRVPGILLAILVGGGCMTAAECQRRNWHRERQFAMVAGTGLIAFELAELTWIGFQPLEAVFGAVGATVAVLAARGTSGRPEHPGPTEAGAGRQQTKEERVV